MARTETEVVEAANQIHQATGRRTFAISCDINDKSSIDSTVRQVLESFGQIDILVNNAGTTVRHTAFELSEEEWGNEIEQELFYYGETNNCWRKGEIILLGPSDPDGLDFQKVAKILQDRQQQLFASIKTTIWISREAMSIEELQALFEECSNMMKVMTRLGRYGEIFLVEEMNIFDLLYAGSVQEQLLTYATRTLEKLLNYDEKSGGTTLITTLHIFLANECNLQRTAKELNVSLSGLKYRFQRLKEIGEIDFNHPNQKFNLQLA